MDTPSSLASASAGADVVVGGRVLALSATGFTLADALATVAVHADTSSPAVAIGAWVVVRGRREGGLISARTVERCEGSSTEPTGDSDWSWLAQSERASSLVKRGALLRALRDHFLARGYVEVETPAIVPSPGMDSHLDAFEVLGAGGPRWLITSPEYQMKRLVAAGFPRIFQLARCFRRGEHGAHHEPEFTMLEWYEALETFDGLLAQTELLVADVCRELHGTTKIAVGNQQIDLAPPWERLTVAEALQQYAGEDAYQLATNEERFFRTWIEHVEPSLGQGRPTFVTHFPLSMASNAAKDPKDPRIALRVEAYVAGVELSNGFEEVTDANVQRARFESELTRRESQGRPPYPIDEQLLSALAQGMPPCVGNALGVDRLAMLLLGRAALDEVIAIPALRNGR